MRSFELRLLKLEQLERARDAGPWYIVLAHEDDPLPPDLPPDWEGKLYIRFGPDDWDPDTA